MESINQTEFEQALKKEFISEAKELNFVLSKTIGLLRKSPSDVGLLDDLYAAVHTLKASASSVGFSHLATYVQALENLVALLQLTKLVISPGSIETLRLCNHFMASYLEALEQDVNDQYEDHSVFLAVEKTVTEIKKEFARSKKTRESAGGSSTGHGLDKPLIMIIEDDRALADIAEHWFLECGYQTEVAHDGTLAVEKFVRGVRPDVIVTDLKMPQMSGMEVLETFKKSAPEIPVIVVSAFAERNDMVEFFKNGAFGYLDKPVDLKALYSIVNHAVLEKRTKERLRRLTVLNNRAYLKLIKTTSHVASLADRQKIKVAMQELDGIFEEVGQLMRSIIESREDSPFDDRSRAS